MRQYFNFPAGSTCRSILTGFDHDLLNLCVTRRQDGKLAIGESLPVRRRQENRS